MSCLQALDETRMECIPVLGDIANHEEDDRSYDKVKCFGSGRIPDRSQTNNDQKRHPNRGYRRCPS